MSTDDHFFQLSADLLCVVGSDGYFKRLNPAWEPTLGFTIPELLARPWFDLVHEDDLLRTRALGAPLLDGADRVQLANRYRCKDGSYRWISWTCSAVRGDGDTLYYGIGRDITEHRQAEEGLERKTAELQALFKALPDLLFHTEADGKIIDYSAGRAADLYAPPETFLGKTFREVLPSPVGSSIAEAMARAVRGNAIESVEYELEVPSGQQRFEARIVPYVDGGAIIVVRNVTDRWLAQESLKASAARLRESERLEATGRLAGGIAHDFNNLMMVVLLYGDALSRKRELFAYRQELSEIRSAAERATRLTQQLLAFARRQILAPTVLDPAAVVLDLKAMLRRLIGEHIELALDCLGVTWCVRADRSQLEQVVLNLALNARDAMPNGGQLRILLTDIRLREDEARQLELPAESEHVRLVVTDTGCGIDPDVRPHIFEPFFTTKGVGRGTGLGLATVYGIVRQSGGVLTVDSTPGQGSSFTVLLPRVDEPPTEVPAPALAEPRGTETVLIVEDELATRRALSEALRRLGYRALEASSAQEALEIAAHAPKIDLLLTDILMPGLSGYELAAKLLVTHPTTPRIYMSGHPAARTEGTWPRGTTLQKPFQLHQLAQCVREAIDTKPAST